MQLATAARAHWRKLLIVPPVLLGVVLIALAMLGKKPPARQDATEFSQAVRLVAAISGAVEPEIKGYGLMRPARVWEAVAQVAGPVAWINPELKTGALLPEGTELIRIDPAEYEAALAQARAEQASRQVKVRSTTASVAIEEKALALLQSDLERKRGLAAREALSQVAAETAERALLTAEAKVQGLRNALAELAAEEKVLEARAAVAALNLARAIIAAPFDLRITELLSEVSEYANRGAILLKADGTGQAEVTAHIPVGRLQPLVRERGQAGWLLAPGAGLPAGPLALEARVILRRGERSAVWPARVSRVASSIDPQTQTVGLIVTVDQPYAQAVPGEKPPLAPNTFVEVMFTGAPIEDRVLIPAVAVREGRVYVANAEDRLEIRPVDIDFRQGRFAIVASGLEAGDRIVVSDLVPAIAGMKLAPIVDDALSADLAAFARRQSASKDASR